MTRDRVLVADDDEVVRELITSVLADAGFAVDTAADGPEALDRVARDSADALVLDLELPGVDGFEVLRRLRADPLHAGLPVLILSGHATRADVERGLALGADDFMLKPFAPWELEARIKGLLRRTRRLGDLAHDLRSPRAG